MTRQSLLNAILDNPGDDLARLVYADWLEEYGGALDVKRANRIREEIRDSSFAGIGSIIFPDSLSRIIDPKAEGSIFRDHGFSPPKWSRGFISTIDCTLEAWLKWGPKIVQLHPIEELRITDRVPAKSMNLFWWDSSLLPDRLFVPFSQSTIPVSIFKHLTSGSKRVGETSVGYDSEADAMADLGQACLKWAKEEK